MVVYCISPWQLYQKHTRNRKRLFKSHHEPGMRVVYFLRCVEKGREKCHQYWPYDTEPVYYGDIQVTIMNESHFPDWNINEFRVMRGDTVRNIEMNILVIIMVIIRCGPSATSTSQPGLTSGCRSLRKYLSGEIGDIL